MIFRALAAVAALSVASPAMAAGLNCDQADKMLAFFQGKYGEVPVFSGVTSGSIPIVVLTSPAGTFTVLGVSGDQLCVFAAGKALQAAAPVPDAPKAAPQSLPALVLLPNGQRRI